MAKVTNTATLYVSALVPGGIKPTDYMHENTNDGTCSRCRKAVREEQVPIILWADGGGDMWIYCEDCLGMKHLFEVTLSHEGNQNEPSPTS